MRSSVASYWELFLNDELFPLLEVTLYPSYRHC